VTTLLLDPPNAAGKPNEPKKNQLSDATTENALTKE